MTVWDTWILLQSAGSFRITRIIMGSLSYIWYLIAVARGEVSFNNTFAKTFEMFSFISMLWFVIFVLRYISITIYFHMITIEANKI
jgi:hypothetical protein